MRLVLCSSLPPMYVSKQKIILVKYVCKVTLTRSFQKKNAREALFCASYGHLLKFFKILSYSFIIIS
jgi:hypothetical protein